jgi:hypothetical protein
VTRDGREYLIPNEDFITTQVINWSFSDKYVRLDVPFGVAYDSDPHEVIEVAIAAAASVDRVESRYRSPVCWITEFGDSSINFLLRFWIDDPQQGLTNIRGTVMLALWDAFKASRGHNENTGNGNVNRTAGLGKRVSGRLFLLCRFHQFDPAVHLREHRKDRPRADERRCDQDVFVAADELAQSPGVRFAQDLEGRLQVGFGCQLLNQLLNACGPLPADLLGALPRKLDRHAAGPRDLARKRQARDAMPAIIFHV